MEDIYAAMMGEPISEEEKMRALAKKMAVQRSIGQTGQILGGRMLKDPAEQMIGAADKSAKDIADFAEQKRNQQQNARMAEDARMAQSKENALNRALDRELLAQRQAFEAGEGAKDRALRQSLDGGTKYRDLPMTLANKLSEEVASSAGIADVVSSFDDSYARVGEVLPPGARALKNWAASKGYGSKEDKDAQAWWANWDRNYTLETRNKMFGSALTKAEREAWDKANISQDMDPRQIRAALLNLEKARQNRLDMKRTAFEAQGVDPMALDGIYGPRAGESGRPTGRTPSAARSTNPADYDTYEEYVAAQGGG